MQPHLRLYVAKKSVACLPGDCWLYTHTVLCKEACKRHWWVSIYVWTLSIIHSQQSAVHANCHQAIITATCLNCDRRGWTPANLPSRILSSVKPQFLTWCVLLHFPLLTVLLVVPTFLNSKSNGRKMTPCSEFTFDNSNTGTVPAFNL